MSAEHRRHGRSERLHRSGTISSVATGTGHRCQWSDCLIGTQGSFFCFACVSPRAAALANGGPLVVTASPEGRHFEVRIEGVLYGFCTGDVQLSVPTVAMMLSPDVINPITIRFGEQK